MTARHTYTRVTPTLRTRARRHRRLALAALRTDTPTYCRLSRYWAHIHRARALEAAAQGGQA